MAISATNLTVETSASQVASMKDLVSQIVNVITKIGALLDFLVGWYLIKLKKWALILGYIMAGLTLAIHMMTLSQVGATGYYKLTISIAVLILLITGRKDFNKKSQTVRKLP
ncbi:MAG: hypothetical protein WC846_05395 [Candidatus Gracilibacteria bacterium]|jgi:hypothetical protein